jgi:hypothetical protein
LGLVPSIKDFDAPSQLQRDPFFCECEIWRRSGTTPKTVDISGVGQQGTVYLKPGFAEVKEKKICFSDAT